MIPKTKIEWADYVWNPIWGCLKQPPCEYCYARKIAKRFADIKAKNEYAYCYNHRIFCQFLQIKDQLTQFRPTFLHSNFNEKFPQEPARIFVGSMSEIGFWEIEWTQKILKKIEDTLQHTFIFLTKFPRVYERYHFPQNCWLGTTITYGERRDIILKRLKVPNLKFISFEPLLSQINIEDFFDDETLFPDWIIIGAQTNPWRPPRLEWIESIIEQCKRSRIPVFMKKNL